LDVAQQVAQANGIDRVVRDYHELLEDPSIEAVMVITSTPTHADIIVDAAAAGKHVFCEKPLALDIASIHTALDAVESAGVKLQVGFNRRYDKTFRRVREIVHSGEYGRPCMLKITSYDPELPAMDFLRASGGMFLDMTIHDFDMARYLIGEVEEVYATGSVLLDPELNTFGDVDTSVVTLRFADDTIGVIDNSRQAAYGHDVRIEVLCRHGSVAAQNAREDTVVKGTREGHHTSRVPHFFIQRFGPCYVEEITQFVDCVRDDKPTPITGRDGLMAVLIGHAAWRSFREHRPVRLSEFE
jgi:myo-inositol 2-dehydrogenase/D-chiro-inositol 1-dehydrogenase